MVRVLKGAGAVQGKVWRPVRITRQIFPGAAGEQMCYSEREETIEIDHEN